MVISAASPSSTSTRRRSPTSSGVDLLLAQDVDDVDVHVPGQQVAEGLLVAVLVEEVGDDDDDPLAGVPDGELAGRGGQVARARGCKCSRYWTTRHICDRPRMPCSPCSSWALKVSTRTRSWFTSPMNASAAATCLP